MTTYGEAFQMGLGSNITTCILNEVECGGNALVSYLEKHGHELPSELQGLLAHVLTHMNNMREVATLAEEYYDKEIHDFSEANTGKLSAISEEIGVFPMIVKMQEAIGMTQEDRVRIAEDNRKAAIILNSKNN